MESLEEKSKRFDSLIEQAERLRDEDKLRKALKIYRQALPIARTKEQQSDIQAEIDSLHDMLAFVEAEEEKKIPLFERLSDLVRDNPIPLISGLIVLVVFLLAVLVFPSVLASLAQRKQVDAPPPARETVEPDKILEGDNTETVQELKGTRQDSGVTIEETDSVVTLTVPSEFLEPYPLKYVVENAVMAYPQNPELAETPEPNDTEANGAETKDPEQASAETPISLSLNEQVFLVGRSDRGQWLKIKQKSEVQNAASFWVARKSLSDEPALTPEEIDARIKERLGGQYWQIQAEGTEAPYSYFLFISAPNAQEAYEGMSKGFERYASKQLLNLLNTYSHQKIQRIEVENVVPDNLSQNPAVVQGEFILYEYNVQGTRKKLGQKTMQCARSEDGRYRLRVALEGS